MINRLINWNVIGLSIAARGGTNPFHSKKKNKDGSKKIENKEEIKKFL